MRDLVLAASIANLCLWRVWRGFSSVSALYPRFVLTDRFAAVLNLILLTAVWFLLLSVRRARGWPGRVMQFLPVLAVFVPLDCLRTLYGQYGLTVIVTLLGRGLFVATAVLGGLALAYLAVVRPRLVILPAEAVFLVLSPLLLFTLTGSAWRAVTEPAAPESSEPPVSLARHPGPRVLWMLFDELDFRVAYAHRPPGVSLVELDRLRQSALFATHFTPQGLETKISVPAMVSGLAVSACSLADSQPVLMMEDHTNGPWGHYPSVFRDAAMLGAPSAISGWYLPYCRSFGDVVARCHWRPIAWTNHRPDTDVLDTVAEQMRLVLPWADRTTHLRNFLAIRDDARSFATDRELRFVFIHWPIPHGPRIYDRRSGGFELLSLVSAGDSYLDMLALVDRTFGQVRRAMEAAELWDSTIVLVTSDHGWRWARRFYGTPDARVPFLLKMPGQKTSVTYDRALRGVMVRELVVALLKGEISTAEGAERWLDQHSAAPQPAAP